VIFQLVDAVKYCHNNLMIVGLLTVDDILLTNSSDPTIKLSRYGLYEVGNGLVSELLGSFWYLSPEILATLQQRSSYATYKSDVWTIGIILLTLFLRKRIEDIWNERQILSVMYSLIKQGNSLFTHLKNEYQIDDLANRQSILPFLLERIKTNTSDVNVDIPSEYFSIISQCLEVLPSKRLSINELHETIKAMEINHIESNNTLLVDFTLNERFYLWNLCGQDVSTILVNCNVIKLRPPIQSLPL
jgi:serine/threonine protein kinase